MQTIINTAIFGDKDRLRAVLVWEWHEVCRGMQDFVRGEQFEFYSIGKKQE